MRDVGTAVELSNFDIRLKQLDKEVEMLRAKEREQKELSMKLAETNAALAEQVKKHEHLAKTAAEFIDLICAWSGQQGEAWPLPNGAVARLVNYDRAKAALIDG